MTNNEHIWFDEQIATHLAHGLDTDERARFEQHRAACPDCAAKLAQAQAADNETRELFAPVAPSNDFEDRIVQRLRNENPRRRWIHPAVRRGAIAAAAMLALGTAGYVAYEWMNPSSAEQHAIATASNLRQSDGSLRIYNQNGGPYPADVPRMVLRAREAINEARYADAEQTIEQILQHEPSNEFARGVAPLVADRARAQERVRTREPERAHSRVPLKDVLRYPENWPDISETPAAPAGAPAADGGGGGVNETAPNGRRFTVNTGAGALVGESNYDGVADLSGPTQPFGGVQRDNLYTFRPDAQRSQREGAEQAQGWYYRHDSESVAMDDAKAGDNAAGQRGPVSGPQHPPQITDGAGIDSPVHLSLDAIAQAGREVQSTDQPSPPTEQPEQAQPAAQRMIIRSGEMEFEVEAFDAASAQIAKIVAEEGGHIASTNSDKLPNGKVKGTITLRVPPANLDQLVLKLRALGDLKRQQLGASDVTKQYTDLQSELRAAQAMQDRLIEMIKGGKGEIKDLLAAEKELAVWRGKTEKIQGEINYYNNLVSLATLTITLYERDIKTPAAATEREEVSMGVETPDVIAAREQAIKAIDEANGRIIESDLKQHDAGQLAARIVADVPHDLAGATVDRLRQLGTIARLDIQRRQTTQDGNTPAAPVRIERVDARLVISLYNLANIAPRQTMNLTIAAPDVEAAYADIAARVEQVSGRVVTSQLNRDKPQQTSGTLHFEVPADQAEAVLAELRRGGEVMRMTTAVNPDTANSTAAKRGFAVELLSLAQVPPRETITLQHAATDVAAAYRAILAAAGEAQARVISSQLNERDPQARAAAIDLEVLREQRDALEAAIAAAGQTLSRESTRSSDVQNTIDSKLRMQISLADATRLAPRTTASVAIQASDVESARARLLAAAEKTDARIIDASITTDVDGTVASNIQLDVPLHALDSLRAEAERAGKIRSRQTTQNPQAPEGELARGRLHVTLSDGHAIVAADQGLWPAIRRGLATSVTGLLWSIQFIIIGVCLIAPWLVAVYLAWRVGKKFRRPTPATA